MKNPTDDSRRSNRRATNKVAVVKAEGKQITCLFRDLSSTGARLRLVGIFQVPDRFRIHSSLEKIDHSCVVIWRKGKEVGVRFDDV